MSANSLHASSVALRSSVCQPPALVTLSSLNLNRFGKRSRRYDRGKTSAVMPPSVVLTDIIETHMLDETTHAHTNPQIPHTQANTHTHIEPPSPCLPLSFFLSAASINQQKSLLSLLMAHEVSSLSLLFLSTFSADLSPQSQGSQALLTNSQLLPQSR